MSARILITDDEKDIRDIVSATLKDEGYEALQAKNSDEAISLFEQRKPDLVLLDIWLENSSLDGIGILEYFKTKLKSDVPVIMMSGHGTIETAVNSIKLGAYDFIEKPFEIDRLLLLTKRALENYTLKRENQALRTKMFGEDELIGKSALMQILRHTIEKAAPTRSRVFITGDAGSGKELVAKQIHLKSDRCKAPFVIVNCAALSVDKGASELFGEEQDGKVIRIGVLEEADKGTVLFDEISEMPLNIQSRLVRMIQEEAFERVGGNKKIVSDVRIIASSTKDAMYEIKNGKLREDLFYRLNVIPVKVPSLNSRRDDIVPLIQYFMTKFVENKKSDNIPVFAEDALVALQAYDWTGNVRQLKNVLEWLLIINPEDSVVIKENMLPFEINLKSPDALRWNRTQSIMSLPLKEARDVFEKEYIEAQLNRFNDNMTKVAACIGMERSALYRKMRTLGLDKKRKYSAQIGE